MHEAVKFGAGAGATVVHPIALAALLVTVVLIVFLPRRKVISAFLWFVILIPQGQQFYIGGVHLFLYRIVVLVALTRALGSIGKDEKERFAGGWNAIDTSFTLYVLIQTIAFSLQYGEFGAIVNQVAFVLDTLGGYLVLRSLIRDGEDIDRALKSLAFIVGVLGAAMLIERSYMVNLFGYIGGPVTLDMREGSVRSFGSFRHPLTAGTAGSTSVPLFMFLWYKGKHKGVAAFGMIGATIMTICSNSSGPLLSYGAAIIGLLAWPARKRMRLVRWGAACSLLALHLVMKAPVWFLVARIDLTGSSSSYHRATLIDQFIARFWEWWLIGTPHHGSWGWSLWDVQNQYVGVGVEGGLGALICFIAIIVYGFSIIGKALSISSRENERLLWVLGVSLFSYMIGFLGVNLFDQSRVLWFLLLATISTFAYPMAGSTMGGRGGI